MLPCFHHQQSWIPTLFTLKCNAFAFGGTLEQSAGVCGDWDRSCIFSIPSSSHLPLEQALALQSTCREPRVPVLLLSHQLVGPGSSLICVQCPSPPRPQPTAHPPTALCVLCACCMLGRDTGMLCGGLAAPLRFQQNPGGRGRCGAGSAVAGARDIPLNASCCNGCGGVNVGMD